MTEGATTLTTQAIRTYANWPSEVPEAFLAEHLKIAEREMKRVFGVEVAPLEVSDDWRELLTISTIQSAIPWLHMITMDGVSKAGRLDGEVDFRFMDAEEIDRLLGRLSDREEKLSSNIARALDDGDDDAPASSSTGSIGLMAI